MADKSFNHLNHCKYQQGWMQVITAVQMTVVYSLKFDKLLLLKYALYHVIYLISTEYHLN